MQEMGVSSTQASGERQLRVRKRKYAHPCVPLGALYPQGPPSRITCQC